MFNLGINYLNAFINKRNCKPNFTTFALYLCLVTIDWKNNTNSRLGLLISIITLYQKPDKNVSELVRCCRQ